MQSSTENKIQKKKPHGTHNFLDDRIGNRIGSDEGRIGYDPER